MKKIFLLILSLLLVTITKADNCKDSPEAYTNKNISKKIKQLVNKNPRQKYLKDSFFNSFLYDVLTNKKLTEAEKVQAFYLMQKNIGYAFGGVGFLPPKNNYYSTFMNMPGAYDKTIEFLKDKHYDIKPLLELVDTNYKSDVLLASSAMLLATLANPKKAEPALVNYTNYDFIAATQVPFIFNHYVCVCACFVQNQQIVVNLTANLYLLDSEEAEEDALCGIYSKANSFSIVDEYLKKISNSSKKLAFESGLNIIYSSFGAEKYKEVLRTTIATTNMPWKKELCQNIVDGKIRYDYNIASLDQMMVKVWDGVRLTLCEDGILINNNGLIEFF